MDYTQNQTLNSKPRTIPNQRLYSQSETTPPNQGLYLEPRTNVTTFTLRLIHDYTYIKDLTHNQRLHYKDYYAPALAMLPNLHLNFESNKLNNHQTKDYTHNQRL